MDKKRYIKDVLYWVVGCGIYSFAVAALITPNEISPGGFTGIATALAVLLGLPAGTVLLALNIPLLIIAFKKLGGGFIIKTVAVTFLLSFSLNIAEKIVPQFQVNPILAAVFGGIISGFGLSLILLRGATTGGVDVIAMLINSGKPHFSLGRIIMLFDFGVIAFAALTYGNIESALYSIITIYAAAQIMDGVLYGGDRGKIIFIVSRQGQKIAELVGAELKRGITIMSAKGGFTGKESQLLFCAVRKHEVAALLELISRADENAFTVVSDAGEIIGQGFKKY